MTKDKSGAGFWPSGFWSGFALAGKIAAERIGSRNHRYTTRRKCSECGKATHPDRLAERNLLPVCLNCREA